MNKYNIDESFMTNLMDKYHKKKNLYTIFMIVPIVISIIGWLVYMILDSYRLLDSEDYTFATILGIFTFASFIALFVFAYLNYRIAMDFSTMYKFVVAEPILKATFEDAVFDAVGGFKIQDLKAAQIIKITSNNCYTTSEDLIEASYKGIKFKQSDITLMKESKNHVGESEPDERLFDGRMTKFTLPFNVPNRILIAKKTMVNYPICKDDPKVELEDVVFNETYDVYSKDSHGVFYLLTPQFMERLSKLKGLDFWEYFSFEGNTLYYLRSGKGGIFSLHSKKFSVHQEMQFIMKDLKEIMDVVDILQLAKDEMKEGEWCESETQVEEIEQPPAEASTSGFRLKK